MRRKKRKRKNPLAGASLFSALYFGGFSLGILLLNFWWRARAYQVDHMALGALGSFLARDMDHGAYLLELVKSRGLPVLFGALSGITIFGVIVSTAGVVLLGLFTGGLLTLGLLELGLKGGLFALGCLMPQYLLYIPSTILLGELVFRISLKSWRTLEIPLEECKKAGGGVLFFLALYFAGIFLEAYVNPGLVRFLVEYLQLF